jgi:hypothetical protein
VKAAHVRFYFDADIMGVGKLVAGLRPDVTYPGDPGRVVHKRARPPCPVTDTATPDDVWIPVVAGAGLVIVTRDSQIQRRPAELNAVREHGARLVALAGAETAGTWAQLEVVMINWRRLDALTERPGPFVYRATRSRLIAVPL